MLRVRVMESIPAAQAAANAAGVRPILYPPMATGGHVLTELANPAFAHEAPGFGFTPVVRSLVD